jgi:alpha-L-rhamnosidase
VTAPGANQVAVNPPRTTVNRASGRLATERGPVTVAWHRVDPLHFGLDLTVPDNVTAVVALPAPSVRAVREGGRGLGSVAGVKVDRAGPGSVLPAVGSGRYSFAVAPPPPARSRAPWIIAIVIACVVVLLAVAFVVARRRRGVRVA